MPQERQIVSDVDFDFLYRVAALQAGLINSAFCPVVLTRVEGGADHNMPSWSGMYYDFCEDKRVAHATIQERVRAARQDITAHFAHHSKALEAFQGMEDAILGDDTQTPFYRSGSSSM